MWSRSNNFTNCLSFLSQCRLSLLPYRTVVLRMRDGLQSEIYTPCGPCKWYLDHHRADLGTMTSPLTKGNNCSTCAVWTIWSWTCSRLWRWQWTSREPTPPSSPDSHSHHHPHPNNVDCMENLKFTGIYNFLRAGHTCTQTLSEGRKSKHCLFFHFISFREFNLPPQLLDNLYS